MDFCLRKLEWLLTVICQVFVFLVKSAEYIFGTIAQILSIVLFAVTAVACLDLLIAWQSLVLNILIFGGAASFVSIMVLRFWKPEKFFKIFS